MNGEQLYRMYRNAMRIEMNCEVGEWDELEEGEQDAWDRFADDIARISK